MDEVARRLAAHERPPVEPPADQRRAAVLVPLFVRDGALYVLLTRRTETVEHHRGQISFPGGVEEEEDETAFQTAVRETDEELGIPPEDVRLLGALSPLVTVTDFFVEPFVGAIPYPHVLRPAEAEIAEVIDVPVAALLSPGVLEERVLPGRVEPTLFYHHGDHVIWGATARMLKELLDALR
ncbi:MAG TPA: CoA pyrophosphatase [Thermoanaerobaculia bacterium]|nr:CoA pyrophosphatase [Thermoanaerobaculia bacterium]